MRERFFGVVRFENRVYIYPCEPQMSHNPFPLRKYPTILARYIGLVQGVPCPRGLGFVDLDLGCSTTLLGQ